TPVIMQVKGKPQLLVAASNQLQGLDPATGEPIWWCKARGFGSSPVYGSGLVYSDSGNGEAGVVVDPTGTGDVTKTHVKWQYDKSPSQYGSAVVAGEYVLRAHKPGTIKCWKLATGEEVYDDDAPGVSILASPLVTADGLVYFA